MALVLVGGAASTGWWWLQQPEGSRAGDERVQRVADAISYPRQRSAAGLHSALLETYQHDSGVRVLQAKDLQQRTPQDEMAELVLHFHQDAWDGYGTGFSWETHRDASDVCYRLVFNNYRGLSERIHCPEDLTPLPVPTPAEPPMPAATCRSGGDNDCPGG
ncbi:hypothetical protein [Kineosporia babensis]|uniref:Uncharacterized protein n=1 Tax=Kineosporia babensis TaxID=499548 RepID=A0A9X1NKY0_9ACTN|nr:hypothetical protein [Kineosporia babensis]MCD5316073.1 hypothetical protein [Kineosporia babensis]